MRSAWRFLTNRGSGRLSRFYTIMVYCDCGTVHDRKSRLRKRWVSPLPRTHSPIPGSKRCCNSVIPACFSPTITWGKMGKTWLHFHETWLPGSENGVIRGRYVPGLGGGSDCIIIWGIFLPENRFLQSKNNGSKKFQNFYSFTMSPFSFAISANDRARCSACFRFMPYVLNFQTFVAPGMTPVIPFSSSAL